MQVIDTMVLVGSLNPNDSVHNQASKYLELVNLDSETYAPLMAVIELDLVMKGRKYSLKERKDVFEWLSHMVLPQKLLSNSISSLQIALGLQEQGFGYFDSLITALAIEKDAVVITTDKAISSMTKTKW